MFSKKFRRRILQQVRPANSHHRCLFCFSALRDLQEAARWAAATRFSEFRQPRGPEAALYKTRKSRPIAGANVSSSSLRNRGHRDGSTFQGVPVLQFMNYENQKVEQCSSKEKPGTVASSGQDFTGRHSFPKPLLRNPSSSTG